MNYRSPLKQRRSKKEKIMFKTIFALLAQLLSHKAAPQNWETPVG
jgi:hypothetical protein